MLAESINSGMFYSVEYSLDPIVHSPPPLLSNTSLKVVLSRGMARSDLFLCNRRIICVPWVWLAQLWSAWRDYEIIILCLLREVCRVTGAL